MNCSQGRDPWGSAREELESAGRWAAHPVGTSTHGSSMHSSSRSIRGHVGGSSFGEKERGRNRGKHITAAFLPSLETAFMANFWNELFY